MQSQRLQIKDRVYTVVTEIREIGQEIVYRNRYYRVRT